MPEVLLTFTQLSWNKGAAAQAVSFVSELRKIDETFKVTLLSHYLDLDRPAAERLNVRLAGYPLRPGTRTNPRSLHLLLTRLRVAAWGAMRRIRCPAGFLVKDAVGSAYGRADLVADLSGDSYRDPPGGVSIAHNVNLLSARAAGIPCVLVSQSLGPFRRYNRPLTRYCLNGARLLYVREIPSRDLLLDLGVDPGRIVIAPDVAFTLPAADRVATAGVLDGENISMDATARPWVGFSVSSLIESLTSRRGSAPYLEAMARVARHVHATLGASVLLVPHVVKPPQLGRDDIATGALLSEMLGHPEWLHPLRGDHGPSELKGVISCCDAFIGARMHAAIAALSSGVPTLAVSWAHKYEGMMRQLGMSEFVWNGTGGAHTDLPTLFDRLWHARARIRRELEVYNAQAPRMVRDAVSRVVAAASR